MDNYFTTPIALIVFNRLETATQVFNEIRKIRPKKLFVIADGPRNLQEAEQCKLVRNLIDEGVNWECEVYKNYSDINLGCKKRTASGLDWFFQQVEEGIIFDDDCLPDQSFFGYCQELLEKYRNDKRVMHISGSNFQIYNKSFKVTESYYFSKIPQVWGLATWRRAWQHYDLEMKSWPEVRKNNLLLKTIFDDERSISNWDACLQECYEGKNDHWDYQWMYTCWVQNGLSISPQVNLVTNIGFGVAATHTKKVNHKYILPSKALVLPLTHPKLLIPNKDADSHIFKYYYDINKPPKIAFQLLKLFTTKKQNWL